MNVFDSIKLKNIDELAEWFDENVTSDDTPWWKWWDENYCKKCESEIAYMSELDKKCECAWCELHGKCKFFKELDDIPDCKQTIKMWLESKIL